jgi:hypothetical protein
MKIFNRLFVYGFLYEFKFSCLLVMLGGEVVATTGTSIVYILFLTSYTSSALLDVLARIIKIVSINTSGAGAGCWYTGMACTCLH